MLKGFLDKYVLADEDGSKPAAPAPAPAAGGQAAVQTSGLGTTATTAAVSNEYLTLLRNAIKARSSAFTALLGNADKLANVIPDSAMRLKAAFEMVKGDGRGLKEILGAIEVHVADLESQRMQFEAAMNRQKQTALGALQAELDGLAPANQAAQAQIQQLQAQMQALAEQINRNNVRAGELQTQITTEGMRFQTAGQQFEFALSTVKSELEGHRTIVSSTLN